MRVICVMHLNEESLMGKEAEAGDAEIAGPTSKTEMATQTLRMPDAPDRIVIMINPHGIFIAIGFDVTDL